MTKSQRPTYDRSLSNRRDDYAIRKTTHNDGREEVKKVTIKKLLGVRYDVPFR